MLNYYFILKQIGLQIETEDIGTAAFEISWLLLDESDDKEFTNEDEITNSNFPDLQYILNQKLISQKQFENFDSFFTPKGFLCFEVLINIWKNHNAFSQHSRRISNNQTGITNSFNLNNANQLITEFTNNSIQENHVNRRKDRWEGCKRLATIPIAAKNNGKYLLLVL